MGTEKLMVGEHCGAHRTYLSRKERILKNLLVLLALNDLCQAKNSGACVGFLRTVGEQRWGGMGTAPIGNTELRTLAVLHLLDC